MVPLSDIGLPANDARMTADRRELKYLLDASAARKVARALARRLPPHRFLPAGATALPRALHYVTTIYFDTPGREVYRAARAHDSNLKLRAKEYYDLHPDLAELATDPAELARFSPVLWLEVKRRDGARSRKRRFGIPKSDVPEFFARGAVTAEMLALLLETHGEHVGEALTELHTLSRSFSSPLRADTLVSYRRRAWQDPRGTLRVTLDSELAFFRPPPDLWSRKSALLRETLGEPVMRSAKHVLEVKTRGAIPTWLENVLVAEGLRAEAHSKFLTASDAVHSGPRLVAAQA